MRHLGSIVLAIVFAALAYVLAGYGQIKFVLGTAKGSTDWSYVGLGIAALVIAGGLYAVLVMTRISPLGPFLAGAAFIAAEIWYAVDSAGLVKLLGTSVLGVHAAQEAPLSGLALFAAVPLVLTIVSPRRWQGADSADDADAPGSTASAPDQTTADTAADSAATDSEDDTAESTSATEAVADKR